MGFIEISIEEVREAATAVAMLGDKAVVYKMEKELPESKDARQDSRPG